MLHQPSLLRSRRLAFTLIELLVVIAIIGVLIALLLPAVQKVREAAANTQCKNNLKQIALACHNYENNAGTFPAGNVVRRGPPNNQFDHYETWTVSILPYLEQGNLHALWDPNLPNPVPDATSPRMATLRQSLVKVYNCPADPLPFTPLIPESGPGGDNGYGRPLSMPSTYRANAGTTFGGRAGFTSGTPDDSGGDANWDDAWNDQARWIWARFPGWRGPIYGVDTRGGMSPARILDITDGTSNTLMIGEYATKTRPVRRSFWAYAYTSYNLSCVTIAQSRTLIPDFDLCAQTPPTRSNNQCKRAWGSFHGGGQINFALADGSVRAISPSIDVNTVMPALGSIAGGEVVRGDF
jgi:prepilin-type N-terminal cleavage/methylation domain-containing protein/prepilin-type processing-associated H-X9-DG protein